jgi:hypothetical protein
LTFFFEPIWSIRIVSLSPHIQSYVRIRSPQRQIVHSLSSFVLCIVETPINLLQLPSPPIVFGRSPLQSDTLAITGFIQITTTRPQQETSIGSATGTLFTMAANTKVRHAKQHHPSPGHLSSNF